MSFNLYFAGSQSKDVDIYLQQRRCCRLFSQLNERKAIEDYQNAETRGKLFIDSGAFSVAHAGKSVNIDDYISFINLNPKIDVWAQLDVIPYPVLNYQTSCECADSSWKNYLYMMERLTIDKDKLLPIYHFGEPFSHLERILNTEVDGKLVDYIGVGGRHGVSTEQQRVYFDNIFKLIKKSKNPNVKVHAFGMTVLKLLELYPFYSADSTTWLQVGVNGGIYTERYGIIQISDRTVRSKENFVNLTDDVKSSILEIIKTYGYTYEEVSSDYKKRLCFNIDYFQQWADNYKYTPKNSRLNRLF